MTVVERPLGEIVERPLTPRELEVMQLICEGQSTKAIAARLGISFKTAVSHRTHIMQKAGVHDAISLFRWAVSRALVSLPWPMQTGARESRDDWSGKNPM